MKGGGVTGAVSHKGATPREQHIYLFPTLPKKSHRHHPFPTPLMILRPLPLSLPSSLQPAKESPPLRKWELRNEYSLSAKPSPSPPTLHTIVLYTLNFSGLCQVFLTLGIALRCHGVCEGRTLAVDVGNNQGGGMFGVWVSSSRDYYNDTEQRTAI